MPDMLPSSNTSLLPPAVTFDVDRYPSMTDGMLTRLIRQESGSNMPLAVETETRKRLIIGALTELETASVVEAKMLEAKGLARAKLKMQLGELCTSAKEKVYIAAGGSLAGHVYDEIGVDSEASLLATTFMSSYRGPKNTQARMDYIHVLQTDAASSTPDYDARTRQLPPSDRE